MLSISARSGCLVFTQCKDYLSLLISNLFFLLFPPTSDDYCSKMINLASVWCPKLEDDTRYMEI